MKASDNVFPKLIFSAGDAPATPGADEIVIYAKADGLLYYKDESGTEAPVGGGGGSVIWGEIGGTLDDQTDLQAALDAKAGATGVPIIAEATTSRAMAPADAGSYHRFTATGAKTATFDDGDGFTAGQEFHITNRAASDNLTLTAAGTMTLNPPKGGTLVLEPGDTVTVKLVAADEADVFGSTVAA